MHFHLPKPLHGWREFTGEVGIIVIGVLIALGAEQLVEDMHWRNSSAAARASLEEEANGNYFAASEMTIAQPCLDRQLQSLEDSLLAPGAFRPVPAYTEGPMNFSMRAPSRSWSDHIWQSVRDDGTTAHFGRDEQLSLANFYALVDYMRAKNAVAESVRLKLGALGRPIQPDAAARTSLVEDIEQARGIYAAMAVIGNQVTGYGEAAGLKAAPENLRADESQTLAFCRAHHLPLGSVKPVGPG